MLSPDEREFVRLTALAQQSRHVRLIVTPSGRRQMQVSDNGHLWRDAQEEFTPDDVAFLKQLKINAD